MANTQSKPGVFHDFRLDFATQDPYTNKKQALQILDKVKDLHNKGYQKVGIIYSANSEQTKNINYAYQNGEWSLGIYGSNQAQVMNEIENLLAKEYKELQHVFRVVPITTCIQGEFGSKSPITDDLLNHDLESAEQFIKEGGLLLGWINQMSVKNPDGPYAIGGGVAGKDLYTEKQNQKVQTFFAYLKKTYQDH